MSFEQTFSTGGLGDFFIVFLKLCQKMKENPDLKIDHIHIESNTKALDMISEFMGLGIFWSKENLKCKLYCEPNYIEQVLQRQYKDRIAIPVPIHGKCNLHGSGMALTDPWWDCLKKDKKYDVCVQVSAGAKSDRKWRFDPMLLATILRGQGLKVALVGSDPQYVNVNDPHNFVCKSNLIGSIFTIRDSEVYVGLSGFHTYWSLASKIKNIHCPETPEHVSNYIHPDWNEFRYSINYGTINEVMLGLKHWGVL